MREPSTRLALQAEHNLPDLLRVQGLELAHDGYIRWIKGASIHPRNWRSGRKVYNAALVMFLDFFMYAVLLHQSPSAVST